MDTKTFYPADQQVAREKLKLPVKARIVLYTANGGFKDKSTLPTVLEKLKGENLLYVSIGDKTRRSQLGNGQLLGLGYIKDAAQIAEYYRAADLYLHASKVDSFPTTILEALACGTPTVATAVGGIPEQIQDGKTGFLVPPHAPVAMAEVVQKLLDDKVLCQQVSKAAAIYAKQHFDVETQVDTFLDWYGEIEEDWARLHGTTSSSQS